MIRRVPLPLFVSVIATLLLVALTIFGSPFPTPRTTANTPHVIHLTWETPGTIHATQTVTRTAPLAG